ncbi:hypothetical protein ElyMa_005476700 [Elysia marginata]|uniref:Uncharacterized protein n=1 Tax=Elysia marginata TaxID=1093978 RepID=A0AAV4EQE9_9GAST|nr:hypothetical protein ElyMa_005476700 [Elysia marginata]
MKSQAIFLLLLLAVSTQLSVAQIPKVICDVIKFVVKIFTGCPNVSILCLLFDLIFGIVCLPITPLQTLDAALEEITF